MLRPADWSKEEKQRLDRQKRDLMKDLRRIFTKERDLQSWLDAPNDRLGARRPSDLLGTPDQQHVVDMVEAFKYGIFT